MRFVSYHHAGAPAAGLVDDDRVIPLLGVSELGIETPSSLLADPPLDSAHALMRDEVRLRAVVPAPAKILCVGLNYYAHIEETGNDVPGFPVLFAKFASNLAAAGQTLVLPPESEQVDYEAELAVIVGRSIRRADRDEAAEAVLGYTVANDITVRDYQYRTHQWLSGKAWDELTPLGPELVTADEVDPSSLSISLSLNGTKLQDADTGLFMYDVPTVLSAISEFTRLDPGDVVLTGTPSGVGYRRTPPVFIGDGDEIEIVIENVGTLRNRFRREQGRPR